MTFPGRTTEQRNRAAAGLIVSDSSDAGIAPETVKVFLEHGSSRNSPDSNTRAARNQTSENYSCHSRAWIVRVYKVFDGGELFLASRIVKNIVRQVRNREMYWGLPLLVSPNWLFRRVPYRLSVFVQHCVLIIVFECTLVDSCDIKV
jgi:hypothetical protein